MKIGIFNRYWSTMGGGEQNAGSYAAYFAKEHEVELIGIEHFDVEHLSKILGKSEIAGLPVRVIGTHATAATEVSSEYDLFISHSYLSDDYSLAPRSIYVCMFPHALEKIASSRIKVRTVQQSVDQSSYSDRVTVSQSSIIEIESPEDDRITFVTSGCEGVIHVSEIGSTEQVIDYLRTTENPTVHALSISKGITILKFIPKSDDNSERFLNLDSLRQASGVRVSWGADISVSPVDRMSFIDSYDLILSISGYTSDWVQTRWSSESEIHYPAVGLRDWNVSHPKQKIILSVGRFFSEDHGHSKRQLQLVAAFKSLIDQGVSGWGLVLVGGCDAQNREYALNVKKAAVGLPIDVILNADHETLEEQFKSASIYWHATGLGMNLDDHPEKAEHFGIAPVEAMSAGCIPILFNNGGTAELIEDGVSGFAFQGLEELVEKTSFLIGSDSEEIDALRRAVVQRSQKFSKQRFDEELGRLMVSMSGDK
jgi:glycosyltransferase involved in cell wall biosynthesis